MDNKSKLEEMSRADLIQKCQQLENQLQGQIKTMRFIAANNLQLQALADEMKAKGDILKKRNDMLVQEVAAMRTR